MTEINSDSNGIPLLPPGGTRVTNSFNEPRQSEETSLGLILSSVRKYWQVSLLVSSLMMTGIIYRTYQEPRVYKSGIQIVIELKETSSLAEKLASSSGGLPDERTTSIETTIQTLRSKSIIQKALNSIADPSLKPSVEMVLSNMTIQSSQNTNILSINYTDTVPKRIVATLDALSSTYIDYSIKTKKARTDKSIAFVESQLPESRKRLERSAKEVQQFRQKYRFIDPDSSSSSLINYRQTIVARLNEATVLYNQTQKQYEEIKKQLIEAGLKPESTLSTTVLTQDAAYQDLFKKFNESELIYNQQRLRFSEQSPYVIVAKQNRDQLLLSLKNRAQQILKRDVLATDLTKGAISTGASSLVQSLATKQLELETSLVTQANQYQSLSNVNDQIEKQISQLPILQKQYTELQRQYSIYSQELTAFLQKLQELKIADAEQGVPWGLLDPPDLPQFPISPDVPRNLGLGALFSLFVGVLVAIGLKKLDNRIDDPETIKSMAGMPILALIPNVDDFDEESVWQTRYLQPTKNKGRKSKSYNYWSFIEAIRTLALGIGLTSDRQDNQIGKVVAMTSALPKEGKSTITFHTSIALSELGYRVLLVDVDLHKSTITRLCRSSGLFQSSEWNQKSGLSDVLLKGDRWEDLIIKSQLLNLHVLFSGPQSVNSITLLNSPRFARLIEQWKQEYDYIIFDTPPVVGVSDTRLIGTLVDGIVYIVSLDIAQRQNINRALDIISMIQVPVLGLVVNRVDNQYSGYYKYYDYYQKSGSLRPNPLPQVLEGETRETEP